METREQEFEILELGITINVDTIMRTQSESPGVDLNTLDLVVILAVTALVCYLLNI